MTRSHLAHIAFKPAAGSPAGFLAMSATAPAS